MAGYQRVSVNGFVNKIKNGRHYKAFCKNNLPKKPIRNLVNNTLDVADAFIKLAPFFNQSHMQVYYNDLNIKKNFNGLKKHKNSLLKELRAYTFADPQVESDKVNLFLTLCQTESIYNPTIPGVLTIKVNPSSVHYRDFGLWFFVPLVNVTRTSIDWNIVNEYAKEETLPLKPLEEIEDIIKDFKSNPNPIEKRGSGVKRLCAFYKFATEYKTSINVMGNKFILAVEEPEISLHPSQQRKFIQQLLTISQNSDIQVIVTTHSPYIVNELDEKSVCILKRESQTDANGNPIETVTTNAMAKRIIKYPSMAEVNYLAFDEPSMTYHQELFCHIEIEWVGKSNGSFIKGILETMYKINSFKNRIDAILPPNTIDSPDYNPSDTASDRYLSLLNNRFCREDLQDIAYDCICRWVRDSIDHTSTKNYKWKEDKIVELSLKILVIVAEYFAKAKKAKEVLKNYSSTDANSQLDIGNKNFTIDGDANPHTMKYCCWYFLNHPDAIIKQGGIVHQIKNSAIFGIVKNSL